ncbi:MAG TPA: transcriptional repressor [bacterium]|nr:transcriptional repressor [bacterium]HOL47195.1 transcriptional repressor [bacterium]HPQ17687.1 transcriptional repressor [bacterium]
MNNINSLKLEIQNKKIKPSLIRIKIYEFLKNTKEHPDAEIIYQKLKKEIPTLSRASVYNALKLFVEKGIIKEIKIEKDLIRYDGDILRHAHFKCKKCGILIDIEIKEKNYELMIKNKNIKILEEQIYLFGLCDKCNKKS